MTAAVRAATRGSPLARWQTDHVATALLRAGHDQGLDKVVVETLGDRRLDLPISQIGGKGVFAKEVQAAVLDGRADLAVHSAKDLPSQAVPGLDLAAVLPRGDPRDALVGARLADLPLGATVASGSSRRRTQLAELRPDLELIELRGNIATRVARADAPDVDAVVVALVALQRLGLEPELVDPLAVDVMLPQVGQGAVAVECRSDDAVTRTLLGTIDHRPTRRVLEAERAFLATLGGDCELPAGAFGVLEGDQVWLRALLASSDGRTVLREDGRGVNGVALGADLAGRLLDNGGRALLDVDTEPTAVEARNAPAPEPFDHDDD